jgi:hypothetical protein
MSAKEDMEQMKEGLYNQNEDNKVRLSAEGAQSAFGEQGPGKPVLKPQNRES